MNKARREAISKVIDKVDEARWDLESIRDEEQEAYDNMPENLQESKNGKAIEDGIETLESILENLENITSELLCL